MSDKFEKPQNTDKDDNLSFPKWLTDEQLQQNTDEPLGNNRTLRDTQDNPDIVKFPSWIIDIFEWIETLAIAVVSVILIFTFVVRTSQVSGSSMVPTLKDKDMLLVSRMFFRPSYGDIVVVTKPNSFNEPIIKRVIATEGQQVNIDFEQGVVYINGIALEEPYVNEPTYSEYDISFPITVPENCLFVMGDNRNHSSDSRTSDIGLVDERYILGKAVLRFMPFNDFGGLYS